MLKEGLGEFRQPRAAIEAASASPRPAYRVTPRSGADPITVLPGEMTSLADYRARMKEGQDGDLLHHRRHARRRKEQSATRSLPQKGIEVLLMTDRVDEWALQFLYDFDGTPLQSVARARWTWASCRTGGKESRRSRRRIVQTGARQAQGGVEGQGSRRARHHAPG